RAEDPNPTSTSFKRRALVMQYTGTACGYCPYMIRPLETLAADADYKNKFTWAAIHTFNTESDPAAPHNQVDKQQLGSRFGISNYPTVLVDYSQVSFANNDGVNLGVLKKAIDNSVANAASAGISATMTLDENNRVVTARVSVKAKDAKVYNVGVLPQGAPSEVLLNRPDIAAAEYSLMAANANIGAARAAFFPRITLVGAYGSGAGDLGDLFTGGTRMWSFVPSVSLPIFTGGAAWAAYQVSQRDKDIAIANYEKAIQVAFKEVADALATEGTIEAELKAQADLAASTKQAYDLAQARYKQGSSSFLEVLESQRQWVGAQTGLVVAEQARAASLVMLYKTLGGGAVDSEPKEAQK
ncbi:MAG: TolC family protein, partial [Burkholderiaceae bacterium]|nr:TolC family protein [Burkholderiaceae bacterium]